MGLAARAILTARTHSVVAKAMGQPLIYIVATSVDSGPADGPFRSLVDRAVVTCSRF